MTNRFSAVSRLFGVFAMISMLFLAGCSTPEERAQAHYQSGKELLDKGEFIRAALEFRNAVRLNEKLAVAWQGLATTEEKRLNWPAVSESLNRVIELDPNNFDAAFKLAKLQLAAIQLDNSLRNANKANELKPKDSDVAALRAAILLRLNDKEGAVAEAERALSINPNNPDAHAVLAAEAMSKNNSKAALTFIERGLQTDPKNIGLLLFKVKLYEDNKEKEKLEETLRTLIRYYPAQKEFRQSLMTFLLQTGRTADVERELRAFVTAEPNDTGAGLDLVRLIARVRGPVDARAELEKLANEHADKLDYQLALVKLNYAERKVEEANSQLQVIIDKGEPIENVHQAKLLKAEYLRQTGKTADADVLVKEVIDKDPKNADALALRAASRIEANDLAGAVTDLREALDQKPNSTQIRVILARAYERQGAIELAVNEFTQVLKDSSYNPEITLQYVDMLRRRGNYEAMEQVLIQALERNTSNIVLITTLAELRLNKGDWQGAAVIAESLLKHDPNSEVAKRIKAGVELGQKKYAESIDTLKTALDPAKPASTGLMTAMVTAYLHAGKVEDAEKFVQSSLDANPKNVDAILLMGNIRSAQRRSSDAEALYRKAIELQPKQAIGYFSLARLFASEKRSDEAEALLLKGREMAPLDLASSMLLASLYEVRGSVDDAMKIYDQQLARTPDVLVIVNNLASLLADHRTNDPESMLRAQALARRLEAVDVPQFKDTVGWIAFLKGDHRTALVNLQVAKDKLPEVAVVRYHFGMALAAVKRTEDARLELLKANSLIGPNDPIGPKIEDALKTLAAPVQ
jgi:cellulose synthase operon protein C